MRRRISILLIFMMAVVCSSFGQKERSINIYATIKDHILRTTIENAKVTLLCLQTAWCLTVAETTMDIVH